MRRSIVINYSSGGGLAIAVPPALVEEFKHMVERAGNTWQDRSPEMDEFCQRMKHGRILQTREHTPVPVLVPPIPTFTDPPADAPMSYQYLRAHCQGHPETCNCAYHCK